MPIKAAFDRIEDCHDSARLHLVMTPQDRTDLERVVVWAVYRDPANADPFYTERRFMALCAVGELFPEFFVGVYDRRLRHYGMAEFVADIRFTQAERVRCGTYESWVLHEPMKALHRTPALKYRRRSWGFLPTYQPRQESPARAWAAYWAGSRAAADQVQREALGNQSREFRPEIREPKLLEPTTQSSWTTGDIRRPSQKSAYSVSNWN